MNFNSHFLFILKGYKFVENFLQRVKRQKKNAEVQSLISLLLNLQVI